MNCVNPGLSRVLRLRDSLPLPAPSVPPTVPPAVETSAELYGAEYLDKYLFRIRCSTDANELAIAMRDYCGYVRQAAVERCVEIGSWENLAGIAERLNDWVSEVRTAARSAMLSLVTPEALPKLLVILPAVQGLLCKSRVDHSEWVGKFGAALLSADADAVAAGVGHADAHIRRACFELVVTQRHSDTAALIAQILRRRSDNVLAWRAVELCATLPTTVQQELYRLALRSSYPLVRAEALRVTLTGVRDAAKDKLAREALLDPKMQPRAVAGAYLTQQGFDRRHFYRTLLAETQPDVRQQRIAIVALGALAGSEDAALFRQSATSDDAQVRRAALWALLRATPEDKDGIALQALEDSDAMVRRIAWSAVTRHGAFVPLDAAACLLERARDPHLLLRFVRLHWPVMAALQAAERQPPKSMLVRGLQQWIASHGQAQGVTAASFAYSLPNSAEEVVRGLVAAGAGG
jgi:HEAT repeat protein